MEALILFHCTPQVNCESIEREGLRLAWDGEPIHLADVQSFAFDSAHIVHEECVDEEFAMYAVDVTGLTLGPGGDGEGSHTYGRPIPVSRLRRVY